MSILVFFPPLYFLIIGQLGFFFVLLGIHVAVTTFVQYGALAPTFIQ